MSDHTDQSMELHTEIVDLLNASRASGCCKVSALAATLAMAIALETEDVRSAFRLAGAVVAEMNKVLGDALSPLPDGQAEAAAFTSTKRLN